MNKLNLSSFNDVKEMNYAEMRKTNGGFLPWLGGALLAGMVYELIFRPGSVIEEYNNGSDQANEYWDNQR
jgi:hypothetical protein